MACFRPLRAFQGSSGEVLFHEPRRLDSVRTLDLPCGQCVGCRLERSRAWAARCMHEASLWPQNAFVTLTYADGSLPPGGSLVYSDFQKFMRRLRKARRGSVVRFYACGEYGAELGRPHFHAILFNVAFADALVHSSSEGRTLYRSAELSRLWPQGHSLIGAVTFDTAAYVARYCMKKITGDAAGSHYRILDPSTGEVVDVAPEMGQMSRRPGIGQEWLRLYWSDVYPSGQVVVNGVPSRAPRYYDKIAKRLTAYEQAVGTRAVAARRNAPHHTNERLHVREQVTHARVHRLRRGFENV